MGGNKPHPRGGLIVGNYCHDLLIKDDVVLAETLGGAVSFISAVLHPLNIPSDYVSKVGPDFAYTNKLNHPPIVSPSHNTTLFHAHFFSEVRREDRILKRIRSCAPISPSDLPDRSDADGAGFSFGMAVGVAGEISPATLEKMVDVCDVVLVDIQALIRVFDEIDGTVRLVSLKESGFAHLLPRIGFLKASAEEAPYVDVEEARKWCCVVVTSGEDGCTVYWKDGEMRISPFPTVQVDPTGAGDSFLGGLVAGLVQGLAVPDAALVGNFFGSLTVGQIGLPEFDSRLMQKVKDEMQRRKTQYDGRDGESRFMKPRGHEQFIASLQAAKLPTSSRPISPDHSMLFLKNSVLEEPIKSVDTKP
ncbi:hypothetical protein OSB04_001273 [Centaurea solstitialis]|uniref:Carbohydrate kinase PfkB domain-containing protein n=1 Tax=Centaurea solstitialis TaxID=347529 RepID=A0AA38WLA1_9ASTR|nr:hypothetical protein OSB04_001273 [Centaurea solstitialis]